MARLPSKTTETLRSFQTPSEAGLGCIDKKWRASQSSSVIKLQLLIQLLNIARVGPLKTNDSLFHILMHSMSSEAFYSVHILKSQHKLNSLISYVLMFILLQKSCRLCVKQRGMLVNISPKTEIADGTQQSKASKQVAPRLFPTRTGDTE